MQLAINNRFTCTPSFATVANIYLLVFLEADYSDHLKLHVIKPCVSLDSKDRSLREQVDIIARMSCYDIPNEIYIYIYIYRERERERERERPSPK
jgi:hypothetical protein